MSEIDPEILLEWLSMGNGDERDMQVIALEQLCMLLLMSDNVDRCFESCPPRSFLPALCHIFMDETTPDSILEVTARAITYYLDVSAECSRRIVTVDGAVKAICARLVLVDVTSRTSKDLAEQCVKVLELMCTREAGAIYEAGGLGSMLTFIREYSTHIHKDTLHSAMSVVARLCGKMETTDETLESCTDSLSKLLHHTDNYVADSSLKCFACVTDRFIRRGVDPAPLAKHGLTDELIKKLISAATSCSLNAPNNLNSGMSEVRNSSGNVSIIVSVLLMLCRGSPSVTHDLLRSNLLEAIETAMKGDERCVLDIMRLVDFLLILLFEGRDALPKSYPSVARGQVSSSRKAEVSGEKSHRHLIDCIQSKDTEALIEAVESNAFDVNFMDDVGQTLLNWASAFGTLEMVEYLCEKGSDVNRGQRSSSLHYAACFGRPAVAKVLLKYGANPELREEDGKTPLDKARERNDEGHKEVVRILQTPGEWIGSSIAKQNKNGETTEDASLSKEKLSAVETLGLEEKIKGDPEMAPVYMKKLVPVFASTYQNTLVLSIKKATLSVLRKIINFIPSSLMAEVASGNVAAQLTDVIATALSIEGDDEGHITAFYCVQDMMSKGEGIFLIHFVRLGVLQKITEIASELDNQHQEQLIDSNLSKIVEPAIPLEDAVKLQHSHAYHWHEWCIAKGRDCLYLWSDFCAIELSNGSNGWFRFVLDNKLATMYSSGSPEVGSSTSESRTEFLDKLQKVRSAIPSTVVSQPILSKVGVPAITVGNWTLSCQVENQLSIVNTDGQQTTILKEDLPGFLFESNRGTKHTFTAETSLGPDFAYSWNNKSGKRFQSKKAQTRMKLVLMAHNIYCKYFKNADMTPHGSIATLNKISKILNDSLMLNENSSDSYKEILHKCLQELLTLLQDEPMLSAYEIQTSGLVTALNNCLNKAFSTSTFLKENSSVVDTFKQVFFADLNNRNNCVSPAVILVKKLIMVLESSEKLPVVTYESIGGGSCLQILLRRLRFKLDCGSHSINLIDKSGRYIKMEPLTTVKEVEKFLNKMVAKQWFDFERQSFSFVKQFKESSSPILFEYENDFDENGIIYWLGTNGKSVKEWVNPGSHNIVLISSSEGKDLPYGHLEDIIGRDSAPVNCHTNDDKAAWFSIDLGVHVIPTAYTLRHARGYGRSALRNWLFQVSKDGVSWLTLKKHENDESLKEPGSTTTWPLDMPDSALNETEGWHFVRLQQNGPNASGQTHYLSVSGFELYGKVTGVLEQLHDINVSSHREDFHKKNKTLPLSRNTSLGNKERSDWKSLRQRSCLKTKANKKDSDWVDVSWAENFTSKTNLENNFNVKVVDISDPHVQVAMLEAEKRHKNESNKYRQTTLDSALRQVVMSFGKHSLNDNQSAGKNSNSNRNEDQKQVGSRLDIANLQFLMAVEDLLDSSSSDVVANALVEAACLRVDQLKTAVKPFRNNLYSSKGRPTPTAEGSRESSLPDTGVNTPSPNTPPNGKITDSITADSIVESQESLSQRKDVPKEEFTSSSSDCLAQIKKISSSISDVFDSMCLSDPSETGVSERFANEHPIGSFSVAENNFLNGNQHIPESSALDLLSETNDVNSDTDEDEEIGDEAEVDDDEEFEKEENQNLVEDQNEYNSCDSEIISEIKSDEIINKNPHQTGAEEKSLTDEMYNETIRSALKLLSGELTNESNNRIAELMNNIAKDKQDKRNTQSTDCTTQESEPQIDDIKESNKVEPENISLNENENKKTVLEIKVKPKIALNSKSTAKEISEKTQEDEDNELYTLEEMLQEHSDKKMLQEHSDKEMLQEHSDKLKKIESKNLQSNVKKDDGNEQEGNDIESMEVDDDNEEDEDFDEDDIENEDDQDEVYEPLNGGRLERHYDHQRRIWDNDLVIKCHHNALVPAFDPRPGRVNVQQTQDIQIPDNKEFKKCSLSNSSKIRLFLRGFSAAGGQEIEIPLDNPEATVFSYLQTLVLHGVTGANVTDKLRKVWEPIYTIIYKSTENNLTDDSIEKDKKETCLYSSNIKWTVEYVKENIGSLELPKSDVINYLQQNGTNEFLKKWKLVGSARMCRRQRNCATLFAAYKDYAKFKHQEELESLDTENKPLKIEKPAQKSIDDLASIHHVLDVIKSMFRLSEEFIDNESGYAVADDYLSKKLTNKLMQQIQDPIALTTGSFPLWCEYLVINYPMLFPFETRKLFFRATAFGCSRSIVWLQNMQDAALERSRGHPTRRLETQEFRLGRLKHERVTVPRGQNLLETAIKLMNFHAERKAILEVEFEGEEGTGLGPSLEFYALVALSIQLNDLSLWVTTDQLSSHIDDSDTMLEVNKYCSHPNGLFPAPYPQNSERMDSICNLFTFFGVFLAKCLQDNRLIDLPLSQPFFKMLCAAKGKYSRMCRTLSNASDISSVMYTDGVHSYDELSDDVFDIKADGTDKLDSHYFSDVLTYNDFEKIHPDKAVFIKVLCTYINKRKAIINDVTLSSVEKNEQLEKLMIVSEHGHECKLEDIGLTFEYVPSSSIYGFHSVELKPGGANELVTGENAEEYIKLLLDFTMHRGIAQQLEAFKDGFNRVFSIEKLHAFKPKELQLMLCGEQNPQWTRDELMNFTEPKYGYHKESPGFLRFINVLLDMNGKERKEFLQFATGCSSLPPGGISNLYPRLTVVKKEDEGDGSFPSVNTCVHYLKLPEYSSEQLLKEKLLAATKEKGFYLN
ncbi:E3 ubiquitin-protein ligase HECTD1 isoform X2 [Hydra vulgaris]|uniref:E3 ubiquitin-protein ligase HECTD1 isoform X2 n=1 Tax=Hydra vulgaris TaxID=6087 RepID=UPI001F5F3CCC|nr:E3 ubiquitin-protein ligase HECTD1 isoform X2 [Hydra vulgaris]